ncbi:MAG: hypothetical protein M1825_000647 [Sarcosagium campestre]|nr:MAG: hypothetical protein M1825_000647 [Sarcosagium campestre]
MQCFTELTPPTAVTHSLSFPFTSADSLNLVVAKTSLLQIFKVKSVSKEVDTAVSARDASTGDNVQPLERRAQKGEGADASFLVADIVLQRAERYHDTKLVLVAEYPLSGTVTSLARVKILESKSGAEALLVAFRDAKLSLIQWDPECHAIATISIHYYEREDLQGSPWAPDLSQCINYLTVDPSSRCAALKFGRRNLAILPFHQLGDDLVMDDYDPDQDGERPEVTSGAAISKSDGEETSRTPYGASFVLPISALDPNLIYPIHLAFLHEYREPTFGILSSSVATSSSLLYERRDLLSYTVFTLDLEQRASTTLLSVSGLPYDLSRVIPLPVPIGGALLVGGNELIHVDQSGKTNGVAVNAFARECTSFGMADQSSLNMRLEGCVIDQIGVDNGDLLMILGTGELAIISFRLDGRSVSGFSVQKVAAQNGGELIKTVASCTSNLVRGRMFIGSEDGDSFILGWARGSTQASKVARHGTDEVEEDVFFDEAAMEDYDDDLYSADDAEVRRPARQNTNESGSNHEVSADLLFRIHDRMLNLAPLSDITLGQQVQPTNTGVADNVDVSSNDLGLVVAYGRDRAGGVAVLRQDLEPTIIGRFIFPEARGIWSVRAKRPVAKGLIPSSSSTAGNVSLDGGYSSHEGFDRFMIVSKLSSNGVEESYVYALTSTGFEEMKGTEFDPAAGGTVDVGVLGNGTRVVQVLKSEIRSYDGNLGLAQILPLTEDITGNEPKVLKASFSDSYLSIIREDESATVVKCDESGDLEELECPDSFSESKWISASLYYDKDGFFSAKVAEKASTLLFLLNVEGTLQIYNLPDLTNPLYTTPAVGYLPPVLSSDYAIRRAIAREKIREIIVADLGDNIATTPYLIIRTEHDDLIFYEPFHTPPDPESSSTVPSLRFLKTPNPRLSRTPPASSDGTSTTTTTSSSHATSLRAISNLGGYATVSVSGKSPGFILKTAKSLPRLLNLKNDGVRGLSGFNTGGCERGCVYVDYDGAVRVAQLPSDLNFTELGWAVKRVELDEQVDALSYHPPSASYAVGTSTKIEYELPKDDDFHREWAREAIPFKPLVDQSTLQLLNPITWGIVDTYALKPHELILCITTATLEVSEHTHARKSLIAVGTSCTAATDLASRGAIYIFDVIPVVPTPGKPETSIKLKLLVREECKGAITALSEVGTQGFLLVAQGQKCMVRGLKEDNTLLPVAFMDMNCYVSVAKCLPRSGMCIMGDALRGLWFVGYSEEPYKMTLFGKSSTRFEVIDANFFPDGDALYIIVADPDCNLHVLQFDPEHPKSLTGTQLLHHRTFHTGHFTSSLTPIPLSTNPRSSLLLHASSTGALAALVPVAEPTYRRLAAIASALSAGLDHRCGLNPRGYRGGSGGVLDGNLLARWAEVAVGRRWEIEGKIDSTAEEVRRDIRAVGVGDAKELLGYL